MYVRIWHGMTARDNGDAYEQFLREKAAPDYAAVDGLLQLFFTRSDRDDASHFLLITVWASMDAIRSFAGDVPEKAKYYVEDDRFLLEKEETVALHRVFMSSSPAR